MSLIAPASSVMNRLNLIATFNLYQYEFVGVSSDVFILIVTDFPFFILIADFFHFDSLITINTW